MKRYKKLTLLHSNDLHGNFFGEKNGKETVDWLLDYLVLQVKLGKKEVEVMRRVK